MIDLNIKETIARATKRVNSFPEEMLNQMEYSRPPVVHEKAHAYPVSVPEIWTTADESFINWEEVDINKPIRLYVHIPWCLSKCIFCFYESKAELPSRDVEVKYLNYLKRELELYCSRFGVNKLNAESLYIGGGTPSALSENGISELLEIIHQNVNFTNEATLASEVSPGTITEGKIEAYTNGGINRISIGVQSFQDHILELVGRDHDSKKAIEVYNLIRKNNVSEINFDIMLALPDQSLEDFTLTVNTILELAPSSVSFLDLRIAPGSHLHEMGYYYPSWKEDIIMRAIYQEMLTNDGRYLRTRPHYYVLPDEMKGRSTRVPCLDSRPGFGMQIGVGVTAYSHIGNVCMTNTKDEDYFNLIDKNQLPISTGIHLSRKQQTAIEAIRSIVDYTLVPDKDVVLSQYENIVIDLQTKGFLDKNRQLTNDGCLFGEEIAYMFYPNM